MRFNNKLIAKSFSGMLCILAANLTYAQDAAAGNNAPAQDNTLVYLMGIIALVLAFVIWGLGQVLLAIGKQALEKNKMNKAAAISMLAGLSLFSLVANAQDKAATEAVKAVPVYGGMDSTAFWFLSTVLFIEVVVIAFMMFSIRRIQSELLPEKIKTGPTALAEWWSNLDKKLFTKAVAVEKEADIMLDHNYDGIRELDNALPPWWKYGFIFTIAVAFIYLLNFHVLGYGKNPTEEYQEEMAKAQAQMELFESKNKDRIDEANLKMPDAEGINAGKAVFTSLCWTCHGKLGEGGAGPNLTDNYWIHKGSLTDIYLSIKHGYPDKGMQAWEKNFSPKEINNLAGFIKTLAGTNPPNPKAPQGDLYTEQATIDSTATAPAVKVQTVKPGDSSRLKKK